MNEDSERKCRDDMEVNQLLDVQQFALIILLYSILLAYSGVQQQKEVINAEYNNEKLVDCNPEETLLQSLHILFLGQLIITIIGLLRYNYAYKKFMKGQYEESIQNNIYTNVGNILWLSGIWFLIQSFN